MNDPQYQDRGPLSTVDRPTPYLRPVSSTPDPGPAMMRTALVAELKSLRRGRGIYTSQIGDRVGMALRALAGIGTDDGPAEIRAKLVQRLQILADDLPTDLRVATLTAFAIAPDSRQRLYKDRVELTATRIQRDPRTARRRIDEAVEQLAQRATAKSDFGGQLAVARVDPWRIAELRLSLALDRLPAELVEQCRLVAEQDGVRQVTTVSPCSDAFEDLDAEHLTTDVFYGGTLGPFGPEPGHRPTLTLPRPIGLGESHEYAMRTTVASTVRLNEIRFRAERRCDRFDLRVRFDRAARPYRVRRIDDIPQQLELDSAGDVCVEFTCLRPGREYGLRWE